MNKLSERQEKKPWQLDQGWELLATSRPPHPHQSRILGS